MTEINDINAPTEPPEEEMYDQWLEEQGDIANEIVDAMTKTCTDKLKAHGMHPSDIDYVSEVLFSGISGHEVQETIWNALLRM